MLRVFAAALLLLSSPSLLARSLPCAIETAYARGSDAVVRFRNAGRLAGILRLRDDRGRFGIIDREGIHLSIEHDGQWVRTAIGNELTIGAGETLQILTHHRSCAVTFEEIDNRPVLTIRVVVPMPSLPAVVKELVVPLDEKLEHP
jgi:hypothetical protein